MIINTQTANKSKRGTTEMSKITGRKALQKPMVSDKLTSETNKKQSINPELMTDEELSSLMDLRVDYAFKRLFSEKNATHRLVNLLNAIFENKQIPRRVSSLKIEKPNLEKASKEDKLSILDSRAVLDDGSTASIEMHMYDLGNHKYETIRSWARIYSEGLDKGQKYSEQNPVICISFINSAIPDAEGKPLEMIHLLFQAMERDRHVLLLHEMELHYINMGAFVRQCKEQKKTEHICDRFSNWMTLIAHKEINDKNFLRRICKVEEIGEAMKALSNQGMSKVTRQAYQRRLDELHSYNSIVQENAEYKAKIADKDAQIAEKDVALADKDAKLADKDEVIAQLKAQLGLSQ